MKAGNTARTIFTLLAGCVLLVMVTILGTWWRVKYRSHQAGEVLVSEAWALTSATERVARPPHTASPLPGSLREALEPLMPELSSLHADEVELSRNKALLQTYENVQHGRSPLSELPGPYRQLFEQDRLLIQRALRASRAEWGGLPKGLGELDEPNRRRPDMLSSVLGLAALEVRRQLEDGQADAALETCLDGLALARDVAYGTGASGAQVSASGYGSLFLPCADALGRATPEGRKQSTQALRRIREGLRPLSWALREESVSFALSLLGEVLPPEQLEALPEGVRYQVLHPPSSCVEPGFEFFFVFMHDWPKRMEYIRQAAPLMDLPSGQRHARLVALERTSDSLWYPVASFAADTSRYEESATQVDGQKARADLLLALALVKAHRAEHGTWPTTLPPLYPEREVLLPTALKLQPAEGDTLRLVPEATGLQNLALTATP